MEKKRKCNNNQEGTAKRIKTEQHIALSKDSWLSEIEEIDLNVSQNIIRLFEEDNTIPFITRYRQNLTKGMTAEKLRQVKASYDTVVEIQAKAESLIKNISKEQTVDSSLLRQIHNARSIEEIEILAAPFKKTSKGTLAARAQAAGLEGAGVDLLHGTRHIDIYNLVDPKTPGREDLPKVKKGLQHIMASIFARDQHILDRIEELKNTERIFLSTSFRAEKDGVLNDLRKKYEVYKDFSCDIRRIQNYQVLAISRAENQKVLTVKFDFGPSFWNQIKALANKRWMKDGIQSKERSELFGLALDDAINRLLMPLTLRRIRSKLTLAAERSSVAVFCDNLKRLLLSAPLRGKPVLAIDPGISQGCKLAIVSVQGEPLHMTKIYLDNEKGRRDALNKLAFLVKDHSCETIAIGNGTYSRETESFIAKMIKTGDFLPVSVQYTIVDEQGVSIYSCSELASNEFPGVDPTLISAVSLARRVQDPLAELVKVEPKHLGVGMYQHDISEKKLSSSLNDIVTECVSFVGVDLNVASIHLLKQVAGLSNKRAEAIVNVRREKGPFTTRQALLKVKGIGGKTFQQCAGFVRIIPSTAKIDGKDCKFNPLDRTEVHPEDYKTAESIMKDLELSINDLGSTSFIRTISEAVNSKARLDAMAEKYSVDRATIEQVIKALQCHLDRDLRDLSEAPVFRKEITSIQSLRPGNELLGVVRNVVDFGAFVDVGVGVSGLIHSSQLPVNKAQWVKLGDHIQVTVKSVDVSRSRIGLTLTKR